MEKDRGEIKAKIIYLFLLKNKKKEMRMEHENNL